MYNMPLRWSYLHSRFRIRIFDGVNHSVEMMGFDYDLAGSDLCHGIFRRIFSLELLPFSFLRFGPVSLENAITEPLLF